MDESNLSVVCFTCTKQRLQRIVSWNQESSKVDEELSGDVEEDEKEVHPEESKEGVDLRDGGLLLKIVEYLIFG